MWSSPPLDYSLPLFRPPSEAASLLLQLTVGCSHNKCSFCAMYSTKKFAVRDLHQIENDLTIVKKWSHKTGIQHEKLFLCDGDALAAPTDLIGATADLIHENLPNIRRIGLYATAQNVMEKSVEDLRFIRSKGVNIAYLGLESGFDPILSFIKKGATAQEMLESVQKLKTAGFKTSIIVMLGIAGKAASKEHCIESAKILSQMVPDYLSFLVTTPVPGTPYERDIKKGNILPLTIKDLLVEMREIIAGLNVSPKDEVIFRANHVSNFLPLGGNLPRDQHALLRTLEDWIEKSPDHEYPKMDPFSL